MSATSARAHARRIREKGGGEFRASLTKDAMDMLWRLSIHHRLDRREVVERLILGVPLSVGDPIHGLNDAEMKAYRDLAASPQIPRCNSQD